MMVSKANRYESIETENHRHESRNTQKKPRKFGFQHTLQSGDVAVHRATMPKREVLRQRCAQSGGHRGERSGRYARPPLEERGAARIDTCGEEHSAVSRKLNEIAVDKDDEALVQREIEHR